MYLLNKDQLSFFNQQKNSLNFYKNPTILSDLPFEDIYEVSRKEASRKKPIFFIHKYFARRVTANFRLTMIYSLSEQIQDWKTLYQKHSVDSKNPITILDPFMGGGTTIFESLRLGANTIGVDLQPLSKFITTAEVKPLDVEKLDNSLATIEKNIGNEIKKHYLTSCPSCSSKADVMYNFHVKTAVYNDNKYRLFSSYTISSYKNLYTLVCPSCLDIYKHDYNDGSACCPNCSHIIPSPSDGNIKRGKLIDVDNNIEIPLMSLTPESGYPFSSEIYAQEYYCSECHSKGYKKANKEDKQKYQSAIDEFDEVHQNLYLPNIEIPSGRNTNQIIRHNYKYFSDLYNKRQLLNLSRLLEEIDKLDDDDSKFWLMLAFSGMLEMNNMFCRYQHNANKIANIFFNHAYVPISMPVENNVWGTKFGTGSFIKTINKIKRGKKFNDNIYDIFVDNRKSEKIYNGDSVNVNPVEDINKLSPNNPLLISRDSRNLDFLEDQSVDLIITDPPFGDQLMYSELIDFFHSWVGLTETGQKIGFNTSLSPKTEEIIVNELQDKSYEYYSDGLTSVFSECCRVMRDDGFMIFTFHDSKVDSWDSVLRSITNSGFKIVKTYPIHSETRTGAHTSAKNSIVFDIIIICKKNTIEDVIYNEEESLKYAITETNENIERLENVKAEVTIKDLENIFISKYFESLYNVKLYTLPSSENLIKRIKIHLKNLESILTINNITNTRSGWWSEKYGKSYKKSLIEKLLNLENQ